MEKQPLDPKDQRHSAMRGYPSMKHTWAPEGIAAPIAEEQVPQLNPDSPNISGWKRMGWLPEDFPRDAGEVVTEGGPDAA